MRLVAEWRQQQLQQQQEPLVAAAGSCRGTNPGIGAFPAAVMAVRSKDTGMPLTDDLVRFVALHNCCMQHRACNPSQFQQFC
jgi:hypothetical protein